MVLRGAIAVLIGVVLLGCGGQTPSAPPAVAPSTAPSGAAGAAIRLNPAPAGMGCDAMAPRYRRVMFHIDVTAPDQVTAVADTGVALKTFWAEGFQGGSAAEAVVRDQLGAVVVTDGDVLDIPDGAWPRLHGYFVCPSTDALYVLLDDAAG